MVSEETLKRFIKDWEKVTNDERIVSLSYDVVELRNPYNGKIFRTEYVISYSIHTKDNKKGRSKIGRRFRSEIIENYLSRYREKRLKNLLD